MCEDRPPAEPCWCETPLYPARGCCPACVAKRADNGPYDK